MLVAWSFFITCFNCNLPKREKLRNSQPDHLLRIYESLSTEYQSCLTLHHH